jgi:CRP-like cAMP-binding protein
MTAARTNVKPLLDYVARYVSLTPEEASAVDRRVSSRHYLKGQFIVQQGDVCRYESFIVSGCARTFYPDEKGHEHVVMLAIENWWTADLGSFITQTPADYNVQCLESTDVLQFSHDDLDQLYRDVPKMERFFRLIVQNAYVAAQKRIVHNLSLPAKERYLRFREKYPSIEQRVPQYMIASYLGMTKEFLSKIRSELIHESAGR